MSAQLPWNRTTGIEGRLVSRWSHFLRRRTPIYNRDGKLVPLLPSSARLRSG